MSQGLAVPLRAARQKIASGSVQVDGRPITSPSWQVVLGGAQTVCVDGRPLRPLFHRLLIMHKPAGCLSIRVARHVEGAVEGQGPARAPAPGPRSVFDLIPPDLRHASLGPFGRLDRDTTGLLLIGSDGGLGTLLTDPGCPVQKVYLVTLRPGFELAADAEARVKAGLVLPDGTRCRPALLEVAAVGPPVVVRLTVHEGFYHQVGPSPLPFPPSTAPHAHHGPPKPHGAWLPQLWGLWR